MKRFTYKRIDVAAFKAEIAERDVRIAKLEKELALTDKHLQLYRNFATPILTAYTYPNGIPVTGFVSLEFSPAAVDEIKKIIRAAKVGTP